MILYNLSTILPESSVGAWLVDESCRVQVQGALRNGRLADGRGKDDAGTQSSTPYTCLQPMMGDARVGVHHHVVLPSNHSRRIAFFVVVAYGENLKRIRRVAWNQLLACMGASPLCVFRCCSWAAFSLNLPYRVLKTHD